MTHVLPYCGWLAVGDGVGLDVGEGVRDGDVGVAASLAQLPRIKPTAITKINEIRNSFFTVTPPLVFIYF